MGLIDSAYRAIDGLIQLFQHSGRFDPKVKQHILLDISTKIRIRTLRSIFILFERAGYSVLLRAHLSRWLVSSARSLRWHPAVKLTWRALGFEHLAAIGTDDLREELDQLYAHKVIHLRYDYNPRLHLGEADFAMPYLMHAQLYVQYHADTKLDQLRQNPKRVRLLFAGNPTRTAMITQSSMNCLA